MSVASSRTRRQGKNGSNGETTSTIRTISEDTVTIEEIDEHQPVINSPPKSIDSYRPQNHSPLSANWLCQCCNTKNAPERNLCRNCQQVNKYFKHR